MYDVLALLITSALFALGLAYMAGCERLKGGPR
jgi:hypothetical protein